MESFTDFCERKRWQYGEKFDDCDIDKKFIPYFESGQRIEVIDGYKDKHQGYVSITTGWKPIFILCLNKRSIGSSVILNHNCGIVREFNTYRNR